MRTSCHRKREAEVSGLIKRGKMEHFYILHPSLKRTKSNSNIKKELAMFPLCNIVLKCDVLKCEKYSKMITCKINELEEKGYGRLMVHLSNGDILLNFTDDISSDVYMPSSCMMCIDKPTKTSNLCEKPGCTKVALSQLCKSCADCCISLDNCGIPVTWARKYVKHITIPTKEG